jgi:hypothetical protein
VRRDGARHHLAMVGMALEEMGRACEFVLVSFGRVRHAEAWQIPRTARVKQSRESRLVVAVVTLVILQQGMVK